MTTRVRTLDFLPEIFRTKPNEQFLSASLDTLVQQPEIQKVQGYIGAKFGYGVTSVDSYLNEPTKSRSNYQLEPAVVFKKKDTAIPLEVLTYSGLIDAVRLVGSTVPEENMFSNQFYSWDSFCDLDKLVNFSQYYWLPTGPDPVTVTNVLLDKSVSYNFINKPIAFTVNAKSELIGDHNPDITLVRGGTYFFNVEQDSPFYIQTMPGTSGVYPSHPNMSNREIYGLSNNGVSTGTIKFVVPTADDQKDWDLPFGIDVDLVTTLKYSDIHTHKAGTVSIDGVTDLEGKTIMFFNSLPSSTGDLNTLFDTASEPFDATSFEETERTFLNAHTYKIVYVGDKVNGFFIELVEDQQLPINRLINAMHGTEYLGRSFVKNEFGDILITPPVTAPLDTFYYQDGSNPEKYGTIRIVDTIDSSLINVNDIIGRKNFTSANGVVFTNGLKIEFSGNVFPSMYSQGSFYVEGVGESIVLIPESELVVAESLSYTVPSSFDKEYFDTTAFSDTAFYPKDKDYITISRKAENRNAWSRGNRWFHVDVLKATLEYNPAATIVARALGNPDKMAKRPIIEFYPNLKLFNTGVQTHTNINYINFTETNALLNVAGNYDFLPDGPTSYLFNGSRVIFAGDETAKNKVFEVQYQQTIHSQTLDIASVTNTETLADGSVNVTFGFTPIETPIPVVKVVTIAGNLNSSYNGQYRVVDSTITTLTVNYPNGVRGTWNVPLSYVSGTLPTPTTTHIITNLEVALTPVSTVNYMDQVVVLAGSTYAGQSFYYDGSTWQYAQQKTRVNQPPLFDVFDANGNSFADQDFYPASDFAGSTLFEYAIGAGANDPELSFPLQYVYVQNVGDIVFNNSLNTQTFNYNLNNKSTTQDVNTGYVHAYNGYEYTRLIGWETAAGESVQYQTIEFTYTGVPFTPKFICDVKVKDSASTAWPTMVVYVDNARIAASEYTVTTTNNTTTVTLNEYPAVGVKVVVMLLSDQTSELGYYQIPSNLDHNPYNQQIKTLGLGDIRGHFKSVFNNAPNLTGIAFGPNNFRDQAKLVKYGTKIIQNSASLTLPAAFLRNNNNNFFDSITFNSNEYAKYKSLLINTLENNDFSNIYTSADLLDEVIAIITEPKTETNPFFWSDMLPSKNVSVSKTYTFKSNLDNSYFDLSKIYDFDNANYNGIIVYLTRKVENQISTVQLINTVDYVVSTDEAKLTITKDLIPGDKVVINEYHQTYGSFVPNTPTKLGLYPASIPEVVLDDSFINPTYFIKGHDGSYTRLYGEYTNGQLTDARDRVLLEFETRVFNNLKVLNKTIAVTYSDIVPGYFRSTAVEQTQFNEMYSTYFMNWAGLNRIDYATQNYIASNDLTWNYAGAKFKLDGSTLSIGNWRGLYLWLFDTTTPHKTPWEMLGLTIKPTWWDSHYGEAPYTSENKNLWQDIENGFVWNNGDSYVVENKKRPGLSTILPVDTNGKLVSPLTSCVLTYDSNLFNSSWTAGDMSPAEFAYRRSSAWAYDMICLMAMQKPAKFFNLNVDLDYYQYNKEFDQYLVNDRLRTPPSDIKIYGTDDTTASHSYLNWIVDYSTQFGIIGADEIRTIFNNTDVRLVYRIAGFTSKDMIKFFTENSSPNSTRASLIPDDSYSILLHNNQPSGTIVYSSVIIQKTLNGYKVYGNKQAKAYFTVYAPISGLYDQVSVNNKTVNVAKSFYKKPVTIPYGFEFTSIEGLLEFIKGYGLYLESQGMIFDDLENSVSLSWDQMLVEVLYWIQTGWEVGSTVSVNPSANNLKIDTIDKIVQPLTLSKQNFVLNQNLLPIALSDLSIYRSGTEMTIKALNSGDAISFFHANISTIEHVAVFDNNTIFGDLIFDPITGLRQQRLYVKGSKTANWNGSINAAGFIMSLDTITDWVPNQKYVKGTVVKYKNEYWLANETIIQPSNSFNYTSWLKTSYEMVQQRMLPNQSTRSVEASIYYDKQHANLANDADLLSFSLTGYRPRNYLSDADLDDSTQVNLVSHIAAEKGTPLTAMTIDGVNVKGNETSYDIHENWAIKKAEFGGVLNHNFVQFGLDESKLTGNPGIVSVTNNNSVEGAHQEIPLYDISLYGRSPTNENILPQLDSEAHDVLPSAGYVNLDDVIELGYTIDNFNDLAIGSIYKNDYLWVANKDNDWNVFTPVPLKAQVTSVVNNMNGTATFTFTDQHGLLLNQVFGLINFDTRAEGYHVITEVPSLTSVTVALTLSSTVTSITGTGLAFLLQSQRVNTPRDIAGLPLINTEYDSTKVWVDQAKDGGWKVFKKTNNYTHTQIDEGFATTSLGASVAYVQGLGYFAADPEQGEVRVYASLKDDGTYYNKATLSYPNTNFGTVIKHTDDVIVVSAPTSSVSQLFIYRNASKDGINIPVLEQTIVVAGGRMGDGLAVSGDGNYIFANVVDTEAQDEAVLMFSLDPSLLRTGTTAMTSKDIVMGSRSITVTGDKRTSIKEGQRVTFVTSYAQVSTLSATFNPMVTDAFDNIHASFKVAGDKRSLLTNGDVVAFSNTGSASTRLFNIVLTGYVPDNAHPEDATLGYTMFYVEQQPVFFNPTFTSVPSGTAVYKVSYATDAVYTVSTSQYNASSNTTTFYTTTDINYSIPSGAQLFTAKMNYELVELYQPTLSWVYGDGYGLSIATNYDGSKLFVGAPNHDYSGSQDKTGQIYTYDRLYETFEVERDQKPGSFYVVRLPWYPSVSSKVYVNGKLLAANKYTLVLNAVIFGPIGLQAGDLIKVSSDNLVLTGTLINDNPSNLRSGQMFGYAMDSNIEGSELLVSAPYALTVDNKEGAVYRFTDPGKRYGYWIGVTPAALVEPTYLLINGYRVNLLGVSAITTSVSQNATTVTIAPAEAALLPSSGVVGFRMMSTGDSYSIAYNAVNVTTGVITFSTPFPYQVSCTPTNCQLYTPLGNATNIANAINVSNITNVFAYATQDGRLVIRLRDLNLAPSMNKLSLAVFNGNYLTMMGMEPYPMTQTITSPHDIHQTMFGASIKFNEANSFVVGAPKSKRFMSTKFDFSNDDNVHNDTVFDNNLTTWEDDLSNAGAVYMYDYIDSYDESVTNTGKYVYSQPCNDITDTYGTIPMYGKAVDFNNYKVVVGAPDFASTGGKVVVYKNDLKVSNWAVYRESDQVVDVSKINKVQLFNNTTDVTEMSLDYIDPLQGKLLGVVMSNLDYTTPNDPAGYNSTAAFNGEIVWNSAHVGKIWFDTSRVKFYNYHQNDVTYNSKYWGQVFPGSDVAVYTWVESLTPPQSYTGPGTPFSLVSYTVTFTTDATDNLVSKYYFWVRNSNLLNTHLGKSLTDQAISRYITNPLESGVPYCIPLRSNTFGLVNAYDFIYSTDTNIHIGYSTTTNDTAGHSEFQLIRTDEPTDFLDGFVDPLKGYTDPTGLYEKFIDSFAGADVFGNVVPDVTLPAKMQIGVGIRPRQSMFVDRLLALKNYIEYVNSVIINHTITEFNHLSYLKLAGDEFDTTKYWNYTYWWATGYSEKTRPAFEVESMIELLTVTPKANLVVAVTANSSGNREVYAFTDNTWTRVGLENGTIQFSSDLYEYTRLGVGYGNEFYDSTGFDESPTTETRNVIRAINEEIFVGDLVAYRNKSLTLMFEYIQSENIESHNYLPWLNKTRFVDVNYTVRELTQPARYVADNTSLIEGYVNEVKPYSVVIKDFFAKYSATDTVNGSITDFDLPSYYDSDAQRFVSPQIVFGVKQTSDQKAASDAVWGDFKYFDWVQNLGMSIGEGTMRDVSALTSYADETSISMTVANSFSLPYQGIITIDAEQIAYTSVTRSTGELHGVTRGVNGTTPAIHYKGAVIYMVQPAVILLGTGKNYQLPPKVTAYIDTSIYPAPRRPATLEAIMHDDKVVDIRVIDGGEGYVTTPEIIIESSEDYTFTNLDGSLVGATNLIDIPNSKLTTTNELSFVTGDYVRVASSGATGVELIPNGYYYVKVKTNQYGSTISFFDTYEETLRTRHSVKFNQVNNTQNDFTFTVSVAAKAVPTMVTTGVRNMNVTMKFDRVSYKSRVQQWVPNKYWSSTYRSLGNDASSSEDSSSSEILSSSQGVVLPIVSTTNDDGFVVVNVDYSYSDIQPGQLDGTQLLFYRVTGAYTPTIVNGTGTKAHFEIYRPKFGNNKLNDIYTIRLISPGSGYTNGQTIRISGSEIGGVDGVNDAIILVKVVTEDTGAILVATVSGKASGIYGTYYVKPLDNDSLLVYTEPTLTLRAAYNSFTWNGAHNANHDFGAVGNDYAFLPEPIQVDFTEKHEEISLVAYAGVIWACKEANSDAEFDPAKWQPLSTADVVMTALERIDGFYEPSVGMPPKDHQQLLKGVTYPNPVYLGNAFAPEDQLDIEVLLKDNNFTRSNVNVKGVIYDGSTLLAVVESATQVAVLIRNEALVWDTIIISSNRKTVTGFAYQDEMYVVSVDDPTTPVFVSFDGRKWVTCGKETTFDSFDYDDGSFDTSTISVAQTGLTNVKSVNGNLFAVSENIQRTENSLVWNVVHSYGTRKYNEHLDIAYANIPLFNGYIAIGKGYVATSPAGQQVTSVGIVPKLQTSVDGTTWQTISLPGADFVPLAIAVSDELIVITCESGKILYSTNAVSWVEASIAGDEITSNIAGVAYGNGMFLAFSKPDFNGDSVLLISDDGMSWTQRSTEYVTTETLNKIEFLDENFHICGSNGVLLQTSNGINITDILKLNSTDTTYVVKGNDFLFGYGPEELVAGVVSDKTRIRVTTAPGAWWNRDGSGEAWYYHSGFNMIQYTAEVGDDKTVSFDEKAANGVGMNVFILAQDGSMTRLYENVTTDTLTYTYSTNWYSKTITFNSDDLIGETVFVEIYEFGNAVEKERGNSEVNPFILDEETGHTSMYTSLDYNSGFTTPVVLAYKDGGQLERLTYGEDFFAVNDNGLLKLSFATIYDQDADYVVYTIPRTGKTSDDVDEHYVSFPETELHTEGGTTFLIDALSRLSIPDLRLAMLQSIVEVDGQRLREGVDFTIDELSFSLTLTDPIEAGQLLAVTTFNGQTRQFMSTVFETIASSASSFSLTIPSAAVPAPMAPIAYTNGQRAWVTVDGYRIDPSLVSFDDTNTATVNYPVTSGQIVMVTAMVPSASVGGNSFSIELDKTGTMMVHRLNSEDTTWLTSDLSEADDVIEVREAGYIVDTINSDSVVEQNLAGDLYAHINVSAPDISGVKVFNVTQNASVPGVYPVNTNVNGRPAVLLSADDVALGDVLSLEVYHGDIIEINGEKIHFTTVNMETNTLHGITRGVRGTQIQQLHPAYAEVTSMSSAKIMDPKYYHQVWRDTFISETHEFEVPLQLSNSEPAKFLRINNV